MRTTKVQISVRIRGLISTFFFVRCLDSIIPLVAIPAMYGISRLVYLASAAEQAGLCLSWSQTPEDVFSHDVAHAK